MSCTSLVSVNQWKTFYMAKRDNLKNINMIGMWFRGCNMNIPSTSKNRFTTYIYFFLAKDSANSS